MTGRVGYHAGFEAERSVARHYVRQGYEFAAHRYRASSGEIDLIMRQGSSVVFVEVKQSRSHDQAAERVLPTQMARIFNSASEFLASEPRGQDTPARFDVALVDQRGEVAILENAFAG